MIAFSNIFCLSPIKCAVGTNSVNLLITKSASRSYCDVVFSISHSYSKKACALGSIKSYNSSKVKSISLTPSINKSIRFKIILAQSTIKNHLKTSIIGLISPTNKTLPLMASQKLPQIPEA